MSRAQPYGALCCIVGLIGSLVPACYGTASSTRRPAEPDPTGVSGRRPIRSAPAALRPGADSQRSAAPTATATDYDGEPQAIGDEADETETGSDYSESPRQPHPFDQLSNLELVRLLRDSPETLGAATLGRPNAGGLFNAVQLPEDPAWKRVDPAHAWATPETIEFLSRAVHSVAEHFPGTAPICIGHLSAQKGGPLRPHVSHQSGRDVDVGFYYANEPSRWYQKASVDTLDLPRTWWLIRTLVLESDIEMILLDNSLSSRIERYAIDSGENPAWVGGIFHQHDGRPPVVRHAPGHATHLHLRFFNPLAQQSGRRLLPLLVDRKLYVAPPKTINHIARSGDTLAKLAARYSTTMQAIRQINSMKTYQLVAGASYRIPVSGTVAENPPLRVPARRLQPASSRRNY